MIKILIKALLLVCIILSIYFIVNPSACSNLIAGRVVNPPEEDFRYPAEHNDQHKELLTPQGDSALHKDTAQEAGVYDTNTMQENRNAQNQISQEDADYAIANRYVELEREYTEQGKDTKDSAKEIAYIVMDDFEMTPKEWDAFLQRATESNLFEKIREESAEKEEPAPQAQPAQ